MRTFIETFSRKLTSENLNSDDRIILEKIIKGIRQNSPGWFRRVTPRSGITPLVNADIWRKFGES